MQRIKDLNLFVGTKEEIREAQDRGMKIVCALNRASGFVSHQSVVGWTGKGCPKDHPHYLFLEKEHAIYLNMVDGDDPKYIHDDMVNAALDFIHKHLEAGEEVFVYCSLGESRSPSVAFMYLLEHGLIERATCAFQLFKKEYPKYSPSRGNLLYIRNRYKI